MDLFYLRAGLLILRYGIPTLKKVVAGGQYINSKGIFFGGTTLEEGPEKFQRYIENHLADVQHLVVVDVHTGLGRHGEDPLLVSAADEGDPLFTSLGEAYGNRVSSMNPESGPAYRIKGAHETVYSRAIPNANVCFVAQEFGTYNVVQVVKSLRAENRWYHYGDGEIDYPTKS